MTALFLLLPLLLIVLLNVFPRKAVSSLALPAGLLLCALEMAAAVGWLGGVEASFGAFLGAVGLPFQAGAFDALSRVMFLAVGIVGAVTLMVARYMKACTGCTFLMASLVILAIAGMNGIVFARDLFTLYVFLEVTAVASFILIAFEKGRHAFEGVFKYIVLSAIATTLMLGGIALILFVTGGVSFDVVREAYNMLPSRAGTSGLLILALVLIMTGVLIKSGVMPFHGWLPDAYSSAPAPVSVLLAGIVTKTTGVYTLVRLVSDVLVWQGQAPVLLLVGGISVVVAALAALGQNCFKRMLAYSSISQVGYIILGLGVAAGGSQWAPLGLAGAVFHLFNHAIFKTLLFVNASAVEKETGTCNMDALGGLSDRMPVTSFTSVIAFLSTAGIPPMSGFWSKLIIIVALWKAGFPAYATVAIIASLVTLAYFLSMQRRVFFGKLVASLSAVKEGNAWVLVPSIVLTLITICMGFGIPWLFETFMIPVRSIL